MFLPAHEHLFRALLFEMASGNHRADRRFLSHRRIMRTWRVSARTANKALELLVRNHLVDVADRSGHYLRGNYRERALALLADTKNSPEVTPIISRRDIRQRLIADKMTSPAGMRMGVLLLTPFSLPKNLPKTPEQMNLDVAAASTARGIYIQAEANKNRIDFLASNGTAEDIRRVFHRLSHTAPDGVVIVCRIANYSVGKKAEALLRQLIPVVTIFDDCGDTEMIGVDFNNVGMGLKAAEVFRNAGHKRIGVLCPRYPNKRTDDRACGFERGIRSADPHADEALQPGMACFSLDPDASPTEADKVADAIAESKITALFSVAHELLLGLLPSLTAKGVHAPEALSLLSCSTHPEVNCAPGKVDILHMDFEALGQIAYRALADYRKGTVAQKYYLVNPPYHSYNSVRTRHIF